MNDQKIGAIIWSVVAPIVGSVWVLAAWHAPFLALRIVGWVIFGLCLASVPLVWLAYKRGQE